MEPGVTHQQRWKGDPYVVPTAPLAAALKEWAEKHNAGRNNQKRGFDKPEDSVIAYGPRTKQIKFVMASDYLLERVEDMSDDYVRNLLNGDFTAPFTPLWAADALLSAAGLNHLLHDGTIPVTIDRRWSPERMGRWFEEERNKQKKNGNGNGRNT